MRTALIVFLALLTGAVSHAQPFQTVARTSPQARFFYERIAPNTSVDVAVLRERSMRWLQRELGTRGFDTTVIQSNDTLRAYAYLPLRRGDGLRNVSVSFRVRMLPSTSGVYFIADNFYFNGFDVVSGERYDIPFEEAMDYFEGNNLSGTRTRFDEKFATLFPSFDRLTVEPAVAPNPDGSVPAPTPQ